LRGKVIRRCRGWQIFRRALSPSFANLHINGVEGNYGLVTFSPFTVKAAPA
jgi:hypothetical protein